MKQTILNGNYPEPPKKPGQKGPKAVTYGDEEPKSNPLKERVRIVRKDKKDVNV